MTGENTNSQPAEAGTGKTQEAMVELTEAGDDDIDFHIEESLKAEAAEEEAPPPKEAEEVKDGEKEEPKKDAEPEAPAEEMVPKSVVEKLLKENKHKELTLQKQATEIGKLRKAHKDKIAELSVGLQELRQTDPEAAADKIAEIKQLSKEVQGLDANEARINQIREARETVEANISPGEWDPEVVQTLLEEDGVDDPAFAKEFAANPYLHTSADTIIQFAKRTVERKRSLKMAALLRQVLLENKALKAKPNEVLSKIDAAAKAPRGVQGGAGGRSSGKPSTKVVEDMSEEELEEILANGV
jgi:hypothetical protein